MKLKTVDGRVSKHPTTSDNHLENIAYFVASQRAFQTVACHVHPPQCTTDRCGAGHTTKLRGVIGVIRDLP
jgi:hypothetical protein